MKADCIVPRLTGRIFCLSIYSHHSYNGTPHSAKGSDCRSRKSNFDTLDEMGVRFTRISDWSWTDAMAGESEKG